MEPRLGGFLGCTQIIFLKKLLISFSKISVKLLNPSNLRSIHKKAAQIHSISVLSFLSLAKLKPAL